MPNTETAPLMIGLELEQQGGSWKGTYVVSSDAFRGYQARIPVPETFNSRENAAQHGIRHLGQLIAEQVGSEPQMISEQTSSQAQKANA